MNDVYIPAAVIEAVAVAEWDAERARIRDFTLPLFEELHPVVKKLKLENARAACRAMLQAWPGVMTGHDTRTFEDRLILTLTENPDDKA